MTETTPRIPALAMLLAADAPREARLAAARGVFPVAPTELVEVQLHLAANDDAEVAGAARDTLLRTPPDVVVGWIRELGSAPLVDRLAGITKSKPVLEAIIRARVTAEETLVRLAETLPPDLQEVVAVNQDRLLREPAIAEALKRNPRLSGDVRRRLHELDEEFVKKERLGRKQTGPAAAEQETPDDLLFETLEAAEGAEGGEVAGGEVGAEPGEDLFGEIELPEELVEEAEGELPEERRLSIHTQLGLMSVSEKIQAGFKGNKEVRGILVRDTNKLVAMAAARSPKLTPTEVEAMAALRNVNDDVLRHFAATREWSSKYPVIKSLVRNPKTPIDCSLPFVGRLSQRDLKDLAKDKGVPEVIRKSARILYQKKFTR